jgi:hypothetical protein
VKAQETNQYILENREDVVREKIVRKLTNTAKKDATPTAKTS